ncbi:uncharacterized protein LOC131850836 [Achroia grisella]|uniref:uncharacterized protein LOC131850836 n=1 Tax=Achroia grisella TaxID=688607 RepID=UPI0027D31077|nr:uncharacterized protein LOC131850836 [Achroia grisella]
MGDKEDYLTSYRVFFENFAATVNPEDQLPVHIAGYTITEAELPGEVLYWTTQYLIEKQCPQTLMTPLRRIILDEVQVASKKQPNDFGYKSDDSVYIALRLMQAVTARVIGVCLRYLDNSKLDSLPPPPPITQRDMKTVSCATKNSRRVMEDRHVEIGNLEALFGIDTTEKTSFYAVYDGHAGSAAATYCAAHLHQYLVESPHFSGDLGRAMRDAFLRTDAEFIRKSNQERACGGSTAVAVAVRARQLLAAWAGDSQALLAKRMRLMQLVRPHKPGRQDERERIESSGGTVMFWGTWRVNGQLAVSRAIGDAQYKPYVTARPEIATVDLDGDEDFVVVACDGLWDFVSEDDVALAVYRQLAVDPDDLKAVTRHLIVQAKRQGSADNISIIVVFLKDPRDIAADNCPPMELGLDNALANPPPFAMEAEACKRQLESSAAESVDNDNSDSDSDDLGPETAVDVDDVDADRNHEPAPPTPPAHTVEEGHIDGALLDNVAESGEESEDEWNYYKGEGEREEQNPSDDLDEPPRSETPCQDNSAWETSSVDMNSSPLNPDAPVFIPGSVTGSDVLLAESPRKPVPMDDIELPDVAQFETEAVVRPAELLDLDNCDQLNGHHNVSINETGNLNGNEKCNMDSLGFGFNVGKDTENVTNTDFIQDFERIQKDTTDFCNIQVFQTHSETNPFASDDNDALLERLKNKERDPMSMSFYQEKDDDTCERLNKNTSHVDLNAVQTLPDSDDEDIQSNGIYDALNENDKENVLPDKHTEILPSDIDIQEPNNDIMRFDCRPSDLPENDVGKFEQGDNFIDYNVDGSNIQNYPNLEFESSNVPQDTVLQTDTPESHKLLFEQIPEIPDGKSSELGFTNEDLQDPSESEKDTRAFTPQDDISQDVDMESKPDISPDAEIQLEFKEDLIGDVFSKEQEVSSESQQYPEDKDNEIVSETVFSLDNHVSNEQVPESLLSVQENEIKEATTPDLTQDTKENVVVDVHHTNESNLDELGYNAPITDDIISEVDIKLDSNQDPVPTAETPLLTEPLLSQSIQLSDSPLPSQSPVPSETLQSTQSPILGNSPIPSESLYPLKSPVPESPLPSESALSPIPVSTDLAPEETTFAASTASPTPGFAQSPIPEPELAHAQSPVLSHSPTLTEKELRDQSPLPAEVPLPRESPLPVESPLPAESPLPVESSLPIESSISREEFVPVESPSLVDHAPTTESSGPESALRLDTVSPHGASPLPDEFATNIVDFDACLRTPAVDERLAPEIPSEQADAQSTTPQTASGPTPDLLPPIRDDIEQQTHSELVTDIDIEQLESRAQEICMPVTNEIYTDDSVLQPTSSPAPSAPQPDAALVASPLKETQIAADVAPDVQSNAASVAIAAAAAVVGATAAVAATAKSKTPAKKSPTTPTAKADGRATKLASKPAASPRTPASATKKPTTTTPTAKAATTPTSRSATAPARASTTPSSRPATAARTAAKPATPGTKTTASAAKPATAPTRSAAPRTTAAAPKPTAAREPTAAAKTAASTRAAPAAKPALPRTAAARPAPRPAAARPAPPRPAAAAAPAAPKPKEAVAKPKVTEKKPLTNGDAKDASRAPPRATSRPPAARPAPRPGPRAAPAPAPPKTAAPKPAPRAPVTTKPLDKQTKDLANKRITAKAAPPRTAATKAPTNTKSTSAKPVPKKPVESPKKEIVQTNGLTNGALEPELTKPPPSPPAADNALLPDVIA